MALITDPKELRLTVDPPEPDIQVAKEIPGRKRLPPFPLIEKLREVYVAAEAYAKDHGEPTLYWALSEAIAFAEFVEPKP